MKAQGRHCRLPGLQRRGTGAHSGAPPGVETGVCWNIAKSPAPARPIRNAEAPERLALHPQAVHAEGIAVVFLATPPEVSMELAPAMLDAGSARGRPERRLPPAHAGELRRLVQGDPHPAGAAGRSGLRPAGVLPRAHSRRAAGGQPGLLSDGGQPGDPAAGRSRRGGPRRRASSATPNRASAARAASRASRPASARSPRTSRRIPFCTTGTCRRCC